MKTCVKKQMAHGAQCFCLFLFCADCFVYFYGGDD